MRAIIRFLFLVIFAIGINHTSSAQKWLEMMHDPSANFYDTQREFYKYWEPILAKQKEEKLKKEKEEAREKRKDTSGKEQGATAASEEEESESNMPNYFLFKRWEWFMEPRVYPSGDISQALVVWENYLKYLEENNLPFPEGAPKPSK